MRTTHTGRKVATLTMAAVMVALVAAPLIEAGSATNVGRHAYKVNVIGRTNEWNGDDTGSDSKTLFIGLDTAPADASLCEASSGVTDDAAGGAALDAVPAGRQTISFRVGEFAVLDRDATDGRAVIQMPADTAGYDIYIRVLGKPGGCLDADAYAMVNATTYYYAGHLDANRKSGAPEKVSVDDLFDVYVDMDGDGLTDTEVSVFDSMFQDYFWQVQNNGLRNMQLIFYAR